ncbi:hypothetical protein BDB01DRAFT_852207 [Pilobolus umbonatus]|nr:hypothetical protein BDB01DRAFT_852207 [Pilobolus umbonatus]
MKTKPLSTFQELSDLLEVLKELKLKMDQPKTIITQLKPPAVNTIRKGRKATRGVKSGVERMKIAREIFEEEQKREMAGRKVYEKKQEEIEATDVVEATENNGVLTYTNVKKDAPFQWIEDTYRKTIKAIHRSGDGNCGFRAAAFEVYKDEGDWYKVKQKMKRIYWQYKDILYKGVGTEMENKVEEDIMMNRLDSLKSPCLGNDDLPLWFSTFTCPQVVADTYQRPVILYCYLENFVNGKIGRSMNLTSFLYWLKSKWLRRNIQSHFSSHSHFYSIKSAYSNWAGA